MLGRRAVHFDPLHRVPLSSELIRGPKTNDAQRVVDGESRDVLVHGFLHSARSVGVFTSSELHGGGTTNIGAAREDRLRPRNLVIVS